MCVHIFLSLLMTVTTVPEISAPASSQSKRAPLPQPLLQPLPLSLRQSPPRALRQPLRQPLPTPRRRRPHPSSRRLRRQLVPPLPHPRKTTLIRMNLLTVGRFLFRTLGRCALATARSSSSTAPGGDDGATRPVAQCTLRLRRYGLDRLISV